MYKPDPLYSVIFRAPTGANSLWTGHGDTGNVVNSQANRKVDIPRKVGW